MMWHLRLRLMISRMSRTRACLSLLRADCLLLKSEYLKRIWYRKSSLMLRLSLRHKYLMRIWTTKSKLMLSLLKSGCLTMNFTEVELDVELVVETWELDDDLTEEVELGIKVEVCVLDDDLTEEVELDVELVEVWVLEEDLTEDVELDVELVVEASVLEDDMTEEVEVGLEDDMMRIRGALY